VDLTELSLRTGIDRRQLRYVLDHELVPRLHIKIVADNVGRPRHFADDVGFAIVVAARLVKLGLPHKTIQTFLSGLFELKIKASDNRPALLYVLQGSFPAFAEFGDGRVRLRIRSPLDEEIDTGWKIPGKRSPPVKDFSPKAVVWLDIGRIRDEVFPPAIEKAKRP